MTPFERIDAAYEGWKDAVLTPEMEGLARTYRDSLALHGLVAYLRAQARRGELPEQVAEAVEYVLRLEPGAELPGGRTSEPKPVAEFEAVSAR